jgi:hypothetical protein
MPTIGRLSRMLPVEPKNRAEPNVKMPPSLATSQYPSGKGVASMPTIGEFSRMSPVEPKNWASPNVNMPPSRAAR